MTIRVTIEIAAPLTTVWETLEPIERHVDWMADAESIHFTTDQTRGVGTAFVCVTKVGPVRMRDRMHVTAWEPQSAIGIEHRGAVTGRGRFTLRALSATRTEFAWTEDLTFPRRMGGRLGAAAAQPVLTAIWRRNLRRLKQIVETRVDTP